MKYINYLLTFSLFSTFAFAGISPLHHFQETMELTGAKEIWKIEVDLNKDGKNEVFLSLDTFRNANTGQSWILYKWTPSGYEKDDRNIASFRIDTLYLGEIPEFGIYGMLMYFPAGGGKGSLIHISYDGTIYKQTKLKTISPKENAEDLAIYNKYFTKSNVSIERIKLSKNTSITKDSEIPYLDLEIFMKGMEYSNKLVPEEILKRKPSREFIEKWTAEAREGEPVNYKDYNQDGFEDFQFELKYARGATGNKTFLLFACTETGYSYAGMMSEPVLTLHYKESNNTYFVEYAKSGPEGYFDLTKFENNELKSVAQITYAGNFFPKISAEISEKDLLKMFQVK